MPLEEYKTRWLNDDSFPKTLSQPSGNCGWETCCARDVFLHLIAPRGLVNRARVYSLTPKKTLNIRVHSIGCNNKLTPFREHAFYYQQTRRGRKYCLNLITPVIHGYSVLFSAAAIAIRLQFGCFLNGLSCSAVVSPVTARTIINCSAKAQLHFSKQGIPRWGCQTERWSDMSKGKQSTCSGFDLESV